MDSGFEVNDTDLVEDPLSKDDGSTSGHAVDDSQEHRSQPRFRVKRWRREVPEPAAVMKSFPKSSALAPISSFNRWNEGAVGSHQEHWLNGKLSVGGLAPPPLSMRSGAPHDPPCGGLPNVSIAPPLSMRPHSLTNQLALPVSRSRPEAHQGGISLLEPPPQTSQPLSLDTNVVKPTMADSTTMLALHKQLKSQHLQDWLQLLERAGSHSELYASTVDSTNAILHRTKVVARFAPSTLAAYLKAWNHWTDVCACSGGCPFRPTLLAVADFLQVSSKKSTLGVATAQSRALTWVAKYADLPVLKEALLSPIVKAYTVPSEVALRKEAPLPLSFVVFLENQILREQGTAADRLLMGGLLVLIWSSLRWSDATWVSPSSLSIEADTIRGVANKTKTTIRGMPFALLTCGFLSGTSAVSWTTRWLNLVQAALQRTSEAFPGFVPDFLLPMCGPNPEHPMFVAPMPRSQGILILRRLLKTASPETTLMGIGAHSPKVTFLSWARQVGASEEARMAQGHHRATGARLNVSLYGRDDVHEALALQKLLVHRISKGFRPVTPMLRGGAKPVADCPVSIPVTAVDLEGEASNLNCLPDLDDLADTDSGSSSEDDGHDDNAPELTMQVIQAKSADCIFLLNSSSLVAHVAACCEPDDPACVIQVCDGDSRRTFRFACNVRRSALDGQIVPAEVFPSAYKLCMRPPCAKIFD